MLSKPSWRFSMTCVLRRNKTKCLVPADASVELFCILHGSFQLHHSLPRQSCSELPIEKRNFHKDAWKVKCICDTSLREEEKQSSSGALKWNVGPASRFSGSREVQLSRGSSRPIVYCGRKGSRSETQIGIFLMAHRTIECFPSSLDKFMRNQFWILVLGNPFTSNPDSCNMLWQCLES